MSVHSHHPAQPPQTGTYPPTAQDPRPNPYGAPEFPRHVVTAVLVAHDGARWLPKALSGLHGQERPVQDVIAADTGSADDSARILEDSLGKDRVLYLARRTGFGAAVEEAARTAGTVDPETLPYLSRRTGWDPVTRTWRDEDPDADPPPEPVHWLWLLHDDCEPEPGALAHLLRVADTSPSVAVVGPKLRSWYDSRQLLEAGVSIARSGRRWTGLDRKEQDQGQHDQVRQVLSVSSAGMLVRRDVWEQLGGFDRRLPLMRDDVDFCWRAQSAGHRVMVAPDAVLRHAEAAARERRPIDCARASATATLLRGRSTPRPSSPHRVDKAGAVYTLLANTRGLAVPYVLLRLLVGTLLRAFGYLVAKVPGQALDEVAGLGSVLLRPGRLLTARHRRSGAMVEPSELRPLFPPPGATVRLTAEQLVSNLGGGSADAEASAGRHGAVESGPGDDDADYLEIENFARLKRIARKPAPVLFAVLLLVSLVANRGLYGGGALSGGALLPAPGGVSDLWARVADGWHAVGTGGTASAPPYLAVLAVLATLLFGKVGLAVAVLLVGSVPLAGLTAYFASRPLVTSRLLRAWASVTYAMLPVVTGALASGRIGTAVTAILLPLMARAAVAAFGLHLRPAVVARGVRPGWRSLWALTLLLTITTAFTPVLWPAALLLCAAAVAMRAVNRQNQLLVPLALRAAVLLGMPLVLLAPWSLGLLGHPSRFLLEAGLPYDGGAASGTGLLLLDPGGPGVLPAGLLAGVLLAGLAALMRPERRTAILTAWAAALAGLLLALPANGETVTPSGGIASGTAWPGPALLLYSTGLIAAAVVGAEGIRTRIAGLSFGWRQPVAVLVGCAAAAAPLFAAGGWLMRGAGDPLARRDSVQVPAFVAEETSTRDQARTLVLSGDSRAEIAYVLVRGSGARLGDAEAATGDGGDKRLGEVVDHLVAGSGADQAGRLADYAVRYVLVQHGAAQGKLAAVLDATPGILRVSQDNGTALWRVDRDVARVTIRGKDGGSPVTVAAGPVEAHTTIPAGPAGRVLRVADTADSGWHATLDGRALPATTVDGWAQGFTLPARGGRLDLVHDTPLTHTVWIWIEGLLALVVLVLALPGGRREELDDDLPEGETPPAPAEDTGPAEGRRARRLRAQAEAEEALARQERDLPGQDPTGPDMPGPGAPADDGAGAAGGPSRPAAQPSVPAQTRAPQSAQIPDDGAGWDAFQPTAGGTYRSTGYAPAGAYPAPGEFAADQGYTPFGGETGEGYGEGAVAGEGYGGGTGDTYGQYPRPESYQGADGYPQAPYTDPYGQTPYAAGTYGYEGYTGQQYADPAAPGYGQDGEYGQGQYTGYGQGEYADGEYGENDYGRGEYGAGGDGGQYEPEHRDGSQQ
jgi:GT2 family glycosyltransferase